MTAVKWKKSHEDIYTLAPTRWNDDAHFTFSGFPAMWDISGNWFDTGCCFLE